MAEKKDILRMRMIHAFAQGCGPAELDDAACAWFHDRYDAWITKKKKVGTSPADVWASEGKNFLAKFREMGEKAGEKAAKAGGKITETTLKTAALEVEEPAPCPWCTTKPDA